MNRKMILRTVFLFSILLFNLVYISIASSALEPGVKLPEFTVQTVDGEDISLADFKGKVVILHLWKCS